MPLAPSGELTSIGLGVESTYGTAAIPTIFLPADNVVFAGTNAFNERPGARKRRGRTRPSTGMYMGKGSFDAEADPDNLGALLQLVTGAETVTPNAANPQQSAVVATTSTNPIPAGFSTVTPASLAGIAVGASLVYPADAGNTNGETIVVKAVSNGTYSAYHKFAHAAGVAITNAPIVLAYDHLFTLASPLKFFTAQINEVISARNCVGNKIAQLSLSATSKAILSSKVTTEYQTEYHTSSPVTPSYSTLEAFAFETAGNFGTLNGLPSRATIQSWSVDVNTGLTTDFPNFGGGRLRAQIPETILKVSGALQIAYETDDIQQAFWGNIAGATSPQSIVLPLGFRFGFVSSDNANAAVPYEVQIIVGAAMLSQASKPIKAGSYLTQACRFEGYESINGASDDFSAILTNAASGPSI